MQGLANIAAASPFQDGLVLVVFGARIRGAWARAEAPQRPPHRDTLSLIPYGDTTPCVAAAFAGGAASNTTDLPRKASKTVSTV